MRTLLQIHTSIQGRHGQSSRLAEEFASEWRDANPRGRVVIRDIGTNPVPHLTADRFAALLAKPEARTPEQHAIAGFSDALIEELRRADVIVLDLPLYNFGHVRDVLRFLGIADVEFIYAEGLAMGDAAKTEALAKAQAIIRRSVQSLDLAA